jgi:hypothetical protein
MLTITIDSSVIKVFEEKYLCKDENIIMFNIQINEKCELIFNHI